MWSIFSRDPVKDFGFEILEPIDFASERIFWKLHKGKKKGSGEEVTIFILDIKNCSQPQEEVIAAKNAIKRLKTLKHPNVLRYYDSVECERGIYLATEKVQPLEKHIQSMENCQMMDLSIPWGLFQVARALSFLANDAQLYHNYVQLSSIYVNTAGEWKVGGFEFVSNELRVVGKHPSCISSKNPNDALGFGVLIYEIYNGPLRDSSNLKKLDRIPKYLSPIYNELISDNVEARPNPSEVIVRGRKPGGFLKNDLIDTLLFLEEIQIKEASETSKFFNGLLLVLEKFPQDICKYKILPQLISFAEFGGVGSAVLVPLLKLGKLLSGPEYQMQIVPLITKLFSSTDRATRARLLQNLEHYVNQLAQPIINDKIFSNLITGFNDTNNVIRGESVKAVLHLAPKLNNNNLNVELLKHFARLQIKDDQAVIRSNTTICLSKIACFLSPQTRKKVLIPAFTRVLHDPCPQAKVAGILGLAATQKFYSLSEISSKILPALCPLAFDMDKPVRDSTFSTMKSFLGKLEKVSEDPSLKESFEAEIDSMSTGITDSAATWTGWAVSAITSKFQRNQSHLPSTGQTQAPVIRNKGRYPFGGQSSSSTSTTTSSIPSTPSDLLQPIGNESATDYENEDWDDWGSIDGEEVNTKFESSNPSLKMSVRKSPESSNLAGDGWDNWTIAEQDEKSTCGNDDSAAPAHLQEKVGEANSYSNTESDWNSEEWLDNPLSDSQTVKSSTSRNEEMRKRREERKLYRQQELESRRTKGPMKLGSKPVTS